MERINLKETELTMANLVSAIVRFEETVKKEDYEVDDEAKLMLSRLLFCSNLPYGLWSSDNILQAALNYDFRQREEADAIKCGIDPKTLKRSKYPELDVETAFNMLNDLIDFYNYIIHTRSIKRVVLKSTHPEEYPDKEIICRVIPNDMIGAYLDTIPEEKKFYAHKSGVVSARIGAPGEKVVTTLKVKVDGREYILSEEENEVCERNVDGQLLTDVVVRNLESESAEQYVVKQSKFLEDYVPYILGTRVRQCSCGTSARYIPVSESRLLTQVDENVVIMTLWGAPAVCLAGSYIVTYDAEANDFNTLEQSAFKTTYTRDEDPLKRTRK